MTTLRPGAIVRLVSTTDEHTRVIPGPAGRVELIDDAMTIHVAFDNGARLGLVPGEDVWEVVHSRWQPQPMVQTYPAPDHTLDTTEETSR